MTLSITAKNRDMPDDADKDSEARVNDYVFVDMPTASFEGDVANITDTHIVLIDFTRWVGDEPVHGAPEQTIPLRLADALSIDVQGRVA